MNFKFMILLSILLLSPVASAGININEIMYAPNGNWGGPYNEWIELYNNDTEDTNITNWSIDGKRIGDSIVPARGYLILARNSTKFYETYGLPSIYVPFTYGLSNAGEILNLSSNGVAIDVFDYTPYANLAENNNRTLERNGYTWFESITLGGTPGAQNSVLSSSAPTIQNQTNETENITEEQTEAPSTQQNQEAQYSASMEIISAPQTLKFGDYSSIRTRFNSGSKTFQKARFAAYIYKPSWIARDLTGDEATLRNSPYNSNTAAEISGIPANATYYIVLPLFLKCNTEGYTNATYTARVRAYTFENSEWRTLTESDKDIFVFGESEACKKEIIKETAHFNKTIENNCTGKVKVIREEALGINVTYPEMVFIGENFTTTIFLKNNENISRDLEVYSYIYEHSQVMSSGFGGSKWGNARTANAKKVTLYGGNSTAIELIVSARENTTAEKYTYKVRIDDLNDDKKSEERIYLIDVRARETIRKNETVSNATETKNRITGNLLAETPKLPNLSFIDKIIYKIKSWITG